CRVPGAVLGAGCLVPCLVPGASCRAWCRVPRASCLVPRAVLSAGELRAEAPARGTRHPALAPGTRHAAPCTAPGTLAPGTRHLTDAPLHRKPLAHHALQRPALAPAQRPRLDNFHLVADGGRVLLVVHHELRRPPLGLAVEAVPH